MRGSTEVIAASGCAAELRHLCFAAEDNAALWPAEQAFTPHDDERRARRYRRRGGGRRHARQRGFVEQRCAADIHQQRGVRALREFRQLLDSHRRRRRRPLRNSPAAI